MSASATEGVSLVIRDSIATIVFDQKRRHNALGLKTWLALPVLIAAADRNAEVGLIVLRGAHGNFGAGNDLAEFGALHGNPAAAMEFAKAMADGMRALEVASKPVVAAIEGLCYGASVALTLACDLRIAGDNATFAITPAKLGALYLQSDLHRLVATIGAGQSKKLIYSAQPIGAARAQEIGLVDGVISAGHFDSELEQLTDSILRGSPYTLRLSKEMFGRINSTPAETEETLSLMVEATQGRDFVEGVDAFIAKRPPRFR
jgi:enoyl-CoA hydratase/carnithine racemase